MTLSLDIGMKSPVLFWLMSVTMVDFPPMLRSPRPLNPLKLRGNLDAGNLVWSQCQCQFGVTNKITEVFKVSGQIVIFHQPSSLPEIAGEFPSKTLHFETAQKLGPFFGTRRYLNSLQKSLSRFSLASKTRSFSWNIPGLTVRFSPLSVFRSSLRCINLVKVPLDDIAQGSSCRTKHDTWVVISKIASWRPVSHSNRLPRKNWTFTMQNCGSLWFFPQFQRSIFPRTTAAIQKAHAPKVDETPTSWDVFEIH